MAEKRNLAPGKGLYFEEYQIGDYVSSSGRTITEADITAFAALTGDWNPVHTNAVYAAQTPYGQRIGHGTLGLAIAIALAARLGFLEETLIAFREIREWKFSLPIFIGDTIHMDGRVIETRPVPRLGGGQVALEVEIINQEGKVIQRGVWTVLIKGMPASA